MPGTTAGAALLSLCLAIVSPAADTWQPLFMGKGLGDWKETAFKNPGKARVADGHLVLEAGHPLTGVTWSGAFPKIDYEIRFEAMRQLGGDFFASLTFPVGESFATFVTGGWGGDIVGISSIDGWDASENETRTYVNFDSERWYSFRIRVTAEKLQTWIDEKPVTNVGIAGRTIGLRPGPIDLSVPLGFAAYNTTGVLRKIEYRLLRSPAPAGAGDRKPQ